MTTFRYLTAAQWGMTWRTGVPLPVQPGRSHAVVHHVGGRAYMDNVDAISTFRALNRIAHLKGHSGVDYSALVHYDRANDLVTIGEGNGIHQQAATLDFNSMSKAYCLCGNTDVRLAFAAELEGLARAIVWGVELGWNARTFATIGHKDNPEHPNATGCPGQYLYPLLGTIHDRAVNILSPPPPPPPEEDDMKFIRIDGYQDQFLLIAMSHETKRRNGALGETPIVVQSAQSRQQLEAFFGYQLTPE